MKCHKILSIGAIVLCVSFFQSAYADWWAFNEYHQVKLHALIARANRFLENNKKDKAITLLKHAKKIASQVNTDRVKVNQMLLEAYLKQKQWTKAQKTARNLINIDTTNANDYRQAASIKQHYQLKSVYKAIKKGEPAKAKTMLKQIDLKKVISGHIFLSIAEARACF